MRVTIITERKLNFETHHLTSNFSPDLQISVHLLDANMSKQKIPSVQQTDLLIVSQAILTKLEIADDLNNNKIKWLVVLTSESHGSDVNSSASYTLANEHIHFSDFNLDMLKKTIEVVLERQQLDRMLMNQQDRLQQLEKLALVGELTASVVHDISTPLTILGGHIEQLKSKIQNNQALTLQDITNLEKSNTRLIDIVKTFRKMIHSTDSNPLELFNLNDALCEVVELVQSKLYQKGIDLKFSAIKNLDVQLEGRRQELIQATLNIVMNSIDAVSKIQTKWIHLEVEELNHEIVISVIDSGKGISPAVARKMFEPFSSGKSKLSNLGVGMTIVKRVLLNHGGRLSLDTTSANTKIDLILPKKQKLKSTSNANLIFLIVDDQEDLALFISNEFSSLGYKSVTATSYKEALTQIKNLHPNVIVTDIFMPVGTGLDIYKWVKINSPETIVLFVTGHQLPFCELSSHISPQDIYSKPFNPRELTNSILNRVAELKSSPN